MEALENRRLLASSHFAVIGDFGANTQAEADVANLVKSWNPQHVVTTGDNNYPDGAASTIDVNIGKYYRQFISPYAGSYGSGSADGVNRFWPSIGNHDWNSSAGYGPHLNYFTLPGNERYYRVSLGAVELFVINSDTHEPDGISSTSVQANWLQGQLAASTAPWQVVVFHHPPYTSSTAHAPTTVMRWPFQQWGADAVISGHEHMYERIVLNNFPYFVNGLGGSSISGYGSATSGSQIRYNGDYGAMLVDASDSTMTFKFITRRGSTIDTHTINVPGGTAPAAPSGLSATAASSSQINLSWTDNSSNESGFKIERSTDGTSFAQIATVGAGVSSYSNTGLIASTRYYYRVRAYNSVGDSGYSNTVNATTLAGGATGTTYLSDLNWSSATIGWGSIHKDASVEGNAIRLNGTTYAKGIGTHANSTIVYNLGGQYARFVSDVGVDDEVSYGSVTFRVLADGATIYDSGTMTGSSATRSLDVGVAGVQQLSLVVEGGSGISYDHADWANARLTASSTTTPTAPSAPTNLTAAAVSSSQINLAWTDTSSNESGFAIERSTSGGSFSQVATVGAGVSSYSSTNLAASTAYAYRVRAYNSAGSSAYSNTASATTAPSSSTGTVYLSDLNWSSASIGWGSVHKDQSVEGRTIKLNGVSYAKGIGTHANSTIVYDLGGQYSSFLADIGVDDEVGRGGSVIFQIWADGALVYDSGTMTGTSATKSVALDVSGVNQLSLVVNGGSSINYDHADWAGARLVSVA